jgi:hypothetical protein
MTQYIVTIEQADQEGGGIEVYRRRVECENVDFVISQLDGALKAKQRKPRRDKGLPRKLESQ